MYDNIGKSERHNLEDLGIDSLVGKKIISAKINQEKDLVILDTETGPLFLSWEGDCCSQCYLVNVSGAENLQNATIVSAENAEWKDVQRNEEDYEVIESMGTKIKTDKGYMTFESRLSHNGYYSGNIKVSDIEPMDQYSSPRFDSEEEMGLLKTLEDF